MAERAAALKWGVERRLEFIEFRLFWEGGVNRSDIIEMFDVSVPQASKDLTLYQERAPLNAIYDKSAKRYIASSVTETLRTVVAAIRSNHAIEVLYQSISSPEPRWRWIAPHAIGFDGFRWHVRAFCEADRTFKDFLLSRILGTKGSHPSPVVPDKDADWNEHITLEIGPHPDLSDSQKKVIELDYGMRDGRASIPVRKALRYYAMRRLGLDIDPKARAPQDQQIVLLSERG